MDGWMDGWKDGRTDGQTDRWTDRLANMNTAGDGGGGAFWSERRKFVADTPG